MLDMQMFPTKYPCFIVCLKYYNKMLGNEIPVGRLLHFTFLFPQVWTKDKLL
jgi:hypothetical protein